MRGPHDRGNPAAQRRWGGLRQPAWGAGPPPHIKVEARAQPHFISWVLRKGVATSSHQGAKPRREALFALGEEAGFQEIKSNCRRAVPPDVRMRLCPSGRDHRRVLGFAQGEAQVGLYWLHWALEDVATELNLF